MDKNEVVKKLQDLQINLKTRKYLTLKDIRKVPRLDYYIQLHFRGLGNALKESNLPSSKLAAAMKLRNEELLDYLRDLKKKLGRNPKVWDFTDDKEIYKKYSAYKISWSIYKTRFGGLRKALALMEGAKPNAGKEDKKGNTYFQQRKRFWGEAAELHVTAELLYRGFQAANIPVDEGLDTLAVKDNKTFYFQIKHKDLGNNQPVKLTKSSYERTGAGNVYFIFVLLTDKKRQFLIVPYHIVNDWIRAGLVKETDKYYLIDIREKEGKFVLKESLLDKYKERWEDIR